MSAPQVYRAINAISAELSGAAIPKLHRNERDDYLYRSIDDVLNRLSPLLAKHKLCVLPRVLDRTAADRSGEGDLLLVGVSVRVAFDLVSTADGSMHSIEIFGEALDASDKATAKALSSAYKHAMLQLFCVPVAQIEDADRTGHRLKQPKHHQAEPVAGWQRWTADIIDIAESCASIDDLERLQQRQRALLTAIGRERPNLYATIGATFSARAAALKGAACAKSRRREDGAAFAGITPRKPGERCASSTQGKVGERRAKSPRPKPSAKGGRTKPHPKDQPQNDPVEISETA